MLRDPYHEGELAVQSSAGELIEAERNARVISDHIPHGALAFVRKQQWVVVATLDSCGRPSASVVFGKAGFLFSEDGTTVKVDLLQVYRSSQEDPFHVKEGDWIGLLLIEFDSRRRLPVNGKVDQVSAKLISIAVGEAYPNCPKYIQRRRLASLHPRASAATPIWRSALSREDRLIMEAADTFFVASAHPVRGLDISHRGGFPGFVRVSQSGNIEVPDYPGNGMFNTLGNVQVDPRVALAFLEFESGRILEVKGLASFTLADEHDSRLTAGSVRSWRCEVASVRSFMPPVSAQWEAVVYSPFNPYP